MEHNDREFLWVEKYRPKTVADCVLPKAIQETFDGFVQQGNLPNVLFVGTPGVGKTTLARALCDQMSIDYIIINGSEESGIDMLRTKVRDYATTSSLTGGRKMIIVDEADFLNPQSTQPALRGAIEEFSSNCGFILTANYQSKILPAIQSRCRPIVFSIPRSERAVLAKEFMIRATNILEEEEIVFNKRVIAELITKHFPDFRSILNEMQAYSSCGKIDEGILVRLNETDIKMLMSSLKDKNFKVMRKWVVDNLDNDPTTLFRTIYDALYLYLEKQSIPQAILCLAQYQFQAAHVADQEINTVACFLEIMSSCVFKA